MAGPIKSLFQAPEVPKPEPVQKTPEADADTLGRARAEALQEARRRSGLRSTVYGSVTGQAPTSRPRLIA